MVVAAQLGLRALRTMSPLTTVAALLCAAMVAVFHQHPERCEVLGCTETGYILVPRRGT